MTVPAADPLAPLWRLPGVSDAFVGARADVDAALRRRELRRQGGQLAAEAALRAAQASAAIEGHDYPAEEIRSGVVTDPMVQGALRVSEATPRLADQWGRAPLQVLAKLHVLAARGLTPENALGRPTGSSLPAADVTNRLGGLASLVAQGGAARGNAAPALLLAAVVHGELLALRPFSHGNGVVARAAARLTLVERGLDPRSLIVPEVGHLERLPEYTGSARAYATGTSDGMRSWLRHFATAVSLGAAETVTLAANLS